MTDILIFFAWSTLMLAVGLCLGVWLTQDSTAGRQWTEEDTPRESTGGFQSHPFTADPRDAAARRASRNALAHFWIEAQRIPEDDR